MKVRDIMTSEGLATATLDTTLTEISTRMRDENVGAIPIVDEEDRLAGIITDRDIVIRGIAAGEDPNECTAEDILSEELHTIHPEADIEEAADLMANRQIRRLPVVEDEIIIGMISLGDIAVKSDEDASDALEDISEGVREAGKGQGGTANRAAAGRKQSAGEQVAQEEADYQRKGGRQTGGTRAENATGARSRNASQSQQSVDNDLVDLEGEEEPELANAGGGGQSRQRANQQSSARGRQNASIRGRDSGELRESASRSQSQSKSRSQGASNRSASEENKRQQKVTEMRPDSRAAKSRSKRKAG
ncbi:MAG TPA: CBS domain-containing protein [Candidatus Limnocylindrales bacterium]|nr:CBS domain-containing protein [Candidatus Limnocylindrales bacterium]